MSDSVLPDEDRQALLALAGELADRAATMRDQLRTALFMLGLSLPVADSTIEIAQTLEGLAFQRGRAIAMLEHCDVLDQAHGNGGGG